jgi:ABC-2 type transport system ATP-binding protein
MDVHVENLTKTFGQQKAVNNVSFQVKTGEVLGFLGPNGAGKTTTMKMITGYLGIQKGDIKIGGNSIINDFKDYKKHIGYLPEHNPLYLDMAVTDYLKFCGSLQSIPNAQIDARVIEMVKVCGLNREKHKKIGALSKGYRQRVGLAQAMIHNPSILILDEPTTGLDPNQIIEIRNLIRDLGKEKTVILSTHILPEVEATCDRILIINKGEIVANGTASSLKKQAKGQEVLKVKIEDAEGNNVLEALKALPTISNADYAGRDPHVFELQSHVDESSKRAIFNMCIQHHWALTEMIPMEQKLEDVFRDLTLN